MKRFFVFGTTLFAIVCCLLFQSTIVLKLCSAGFIFLIAATAVFIKKYKVFLAVLWMTFLLSFNFATNTFNPKNTTYSGFQFDSESLVINMISARKAGIKDMGQYGLGWFDAKKNTVRSYVSQYGLQGTIFQLFYKVPLKCIACFCCVFTAFIFALIILLIKKKYDSLLAFCFFITFLLSPWIVNFARNLYWVEFTWFIPMLLGLVCSLHRKNRRICAICYAGAFFSILIKSLCGYEYITVIMLYMISFLVSDAVCILFGTDRKKELPLIFRHIFCMGIFALLGFAAALFLHARLRGGGNILEGMKSIYKADILRRTLGGDPANFPPVYANSLKASILTVIRKYYVFSTEVISHISGKRFFAITILPLVIFICNAAGKKQRAEVVSLYFIFYIASISWYVLGKSHSFIHTHMNYVLWYFGFVQICFYVILKQIIDLIKSAAKYIYENHKELGNKLREKLYD